MMNCENVSKNPHWNLSWNQAVSHFHMCGLIWPSTTTWIGFEPNCETRATSNWIWVLQESTPLGRSLSNRRFPPLFPSQNNALWPSVVHPGKIRIPTGPVAEWIYPINNAPCSLHRNFRDFHVARVVAIHGHELRLGDHSQPMAMNVRWGVSFLPKMKTSCSFHPKLCSNIIRTFRGAPLQIGSQMSSDFFLCSPHCLALEGKCMYPPPNNDPRLRYWAYSCGLGYDDTPPYIEPP